MDDEMVTLDEADDEAIVTDETDAEVAASQKKDGGGDSIIAVLIG